MTLTTHDKAATKAEAQARADQIRAFSAEQKILHERGLLALDDEQNRAIQTYHQQLLRELQQQQDIDLTERARHLSLGTQIVAFLGADAFAASIFFLFYQFWGLFTQWQQVSMLIAAPLLTLFTAAWIKQRDGSGYYAKLAAIISFVCFVLNLVMLGSVFNITPTPNAFVAYATYGFLLAYLFQSRVLLTAALVCTFIFIAAKTTHWVGGLYWISLWEHPENFLLPALSFFTVSFFKPHKDHAGFAGIYQIISACAFFLSVLILGNWGRGSYLNIDANVIEGIYQILGFVISAALIIFGLRQHNGQLMLLGNAFFAIFLCSKFFDWWWELMPKSLFFLVIGLTAILALIIFNRLRKWQQQLAIKETSAESTTEVTP
ncbi:MAG: hypothetical protein B0W54_16455 [Cellvibrio sp. 79]|nr:MAG: hypothetical protein B0W54_16455 [Cellvibrio sp. 79]